MKELAEPTLGTLGEKSDFLLKSEEPTKFGLVGLSGVGVNYLVLFILFSLVGLDETISLIGGISVSMTTNYALNRVWTFKSSEPIPQEFGKYVGSNLAGAVIQFSSTLLLVDWSPIEILDLIVIQVPILYVATGFGIGLGFLSNFIFSKFFVFNK